MRVAITIERFDPALGGGERYCRNFARFLRNNGHEVHVFAYRLGPPEDGIFYHRVPPPPGGMWGRALFASRVERLVRRDKFDIVHGFGKSTYMDVYRPGGGVHRAWQAHRLRASRGLVERLRTRWRQWASIEERLVLRLERKQFGPGRGHRIIAVSRLVRDEIIGYYGCEPERIHVIHNGADLARFPPDLRRRLRDPMRRQLGLESDEVMLLFVGHDFRRKGLHALIRALPHIAEGGTRFRLVVVGRGNRSGCDRIARRLGVEGAIQYVGAADPIPYYAAADIFCFPSYYDPCANVVLEALAAGLPVVTSIHNGSGEIIVQGREGFVVDPDETSRMAACIGAFFDRDRREDASRAARALAESRPIERSFREMIGVYALVQGRGLRDQPAGGTAKPK